LTLFQGPARRVAGKAGGFGRGSPGSPPALCPAAPDRAAAERKKGRPGSRRRGLSLGS